MPRNKWSSIFVLFLFLFLKTTIEQQNIRDVASHSFYNNNDAVAVAVVVGQ